MPELKQPEPLAPLRRVPPWFGLVAAALVLPLALVAVPGAEPDVRRDAVVTAVEKAMPSVVNIATETIVEVRDPLDDLFYDFFGYRRRTPQSESLRSLGSGVIIDEEGFVLTNFHVVRRASRIWVKLADGREFEADRVVGTSRSDVALLKIRTKDKEKFAAVDFAQDDDLLLGETVLAMGNPFGLGGSVSPGILSSKDRQRPRENETLDVANWLQTDAAINPGNSGGPLINLRGQLIGINVAVLKEGQGIGFAIPIRQVSEALSERLTPEAVKSLWFGARVKAGTMPLTVTSVEPDSPAEKAGLRTGDLIRRVNDKRPRNFIEFSRELVSAGDQQDVSLEIRRGLEDKELKARLVPENKYFNAELIRKKLGMDVQELTRDLAETLQFNFYGGFIVSGVERTGPAADAKLQRGF
ncbi:MAG: trypsin-like peptidase domain-containing protein, partial [Pedosphaera parvula]|nr:trypsin-like peptidase domain-containing protein [Pedosphaera parvula]